MNGAFFYIGLGVGLAAACGLRPFVPLLLAGALASGGDLGVHFSAHRFHFLESGWWLLAVAAAMVLAYAAQLLLHQAPTEQRGRPTPLAAALEGLAYGGGAVVFAGTLAAHGDVWWPGIIGGVAAAALAARAVNPIIAGARSRLNDRGAREALTLYLDAVALVVAALVALLHPLGYVALALFAYVLLRTRARGGERYAGLRILGR
ncbi:MAG TPA: hypothetical protein VFW29_11865 [Solirubrobacteraceae bacterium]|nr:hypothetical protein [Solirubrobacteraceae bacterium]